MSPWRKLPACGRKWHRKLEAYVTCDKAEFKPVSLGSWAKTLNLGGDFSGHVTYRRTVKIPETLLRV